MRSTYSYCTVICDSIKSMVLLDEKFITKQIDLYENTINQETILHETHFSHILAGPTIQEHRRKLCQKYFYKIINLASMSTIP